MRQFCDTNDPLPRHYGLAFDCRRDCRLSLLCGRRHGRHPRPRDLHGATVKVSGEIEDVANVHVPSPRCSMYGIF